MATDPTTQKAVNESEGDSLEAGTSNTSNTEKFSEGALNNDIRPGSAEHVVATENTTQQTNLGGSTAIDLEVEKFRSRDGSARPGSRDGSARPGSSEGKAPRKESDDG